VNHPEVTDRLRGWLSHFLAEKTHINADKLVAAQRELGGHQMGLTLAALANKLPIFDVVFDDDHDYSVSHVGVVGS
jgi:hypothetical protein